MSARHWLLAGAIGVIIPQTAQAEVVLSPRVSYYFDNINQRSSGLDTAAEPSEEQLAEQNRSLQELFGPSASIAISTESTGINANQLALPMAGLAATYIDGEVSLTLTGMYGEADGTASVNTIGTQTFTVFGDTATDLLTVSGTGIQKAKRLDIELTAQKRLNERFAIMGGLRFEYVDQEQDTVLNVSLSNNFNNLLAIQGLAPLDFDVIRAPIEQRIEGTYEVWSVRGGAAGFIPFGEGNTVFLNGMLHLSHEPSPNLVVTQQDIATGDFETLTTSQSSETTFGPDIAVGVQIAMAENISFDIRYRGSFYFPVSGGRGFTDPRVNHGVNAGVSFLF